MCDFCHLSCHLVSSHIPIHHVCLLPSQLSSGFLPYPHSPCLSSAISVVIWFLAISPFTMCDFCHLSCHLVSSHIPIHHVCLLPSQLSSGFLPYPHSSCLSFSISVIIPTLLAYISSLRFLSGEIGHRVHVCLFLDAYISHMIQPRLSFYPPPLAHFCSVHNHLPLLFNWPAFCFVRNCRFHTCLVRVVTMYLKN